MCVNGWMTKCGMKYFGVLWTWKSARKVQAIYHLNHNWVLHKIIFKDWICIYIYNCQILLSSISNSKLCLFCRLAGCQVTEKGCISLAEAIQSHINSSLKHLDLSYNHPGDNGMRALNAIVEDPTRKLETVKWVNKSDITQYCNL